MGPFKHFSTSRNYPLTIFNFFISRAEFWVNSSAPSSKALIIYSTMFGPELPPSIQFLFQVLDFFHFQGFLIVPLAYPLTLVHSFPHLLGIPNVSMFLQSFSSCSAVFLSSGDSIPPADCFGWQPSFTLAFLFLFCSLFTAMLIFRNVALFHMSLFHWGGSLKWRLRAQILRNACVQISAPWLNSCMTSGRFLHLPEPLFPHL